MPSAYRKKLIEVALPLDAINAESAREKSIRHGHPSTLHLWWARRPLAACRAVLFAQLVDDPSEYMPDEISADEERERLFDLIEELVKWENINNEEILDKARLEIARSVARDLEVQVPVGKQAIREFLATKAPPVLDPFAGGGSIPLEAQRLGLRAYASDLNPVAVLINKALIEIPPKFANMPPVHPPEDEDQQLTYLKKEWKGAEGLAEDVRYYGKWMRDEAEKRIGHLYPKYKITEELLDERPDLLEQGLKFGDELTVIAWLWARTVKCPNPACTAQMPLVKSFALSTRKGKEAYINPIVIDNTVRFSVEVGSRNFPESTVNRGGARCLICDTPVPFDHVRAEGQSGRMGTQLMSIVVNSKRGRLFLPPNEEHENVAQSTIPKGKPETDLQGKAAVNVPLYGFRTHGDLFTNRQLLALTLLSELVIKARALVVSNEYLCGDQYFNAYADAIVTYLGLGVSRLSDISNAFCMWESNKTQVRHVFTRQAIPMLWDFAEPNIFSRAAGDYGTSLTNLSLALERTPALGLGESILSNATDPHPLNFKPLISTDPPYYDNVAYADLADFFYVWIRKW